MWSRGRGMVEHAEREMEEARGDCLYYVDHAGDVSGKGVTLRLYLLHIKHHLDLTQSLQPAKLGKERSATAPGFSAEGQYQSPVSAAEESMSLVRY